MRIFVAKNQNHAKADFASGQVPSSGEIQIYGWSVLPSLPSSSLLNCDNIAFISLLLLIWFGTNLCRCSSRWSWVSFFARPLFAAHWVCQDQIPLYRMDTTLRELVDAIKAVNDEAQKTSTLFTFSSVYPDGRSPLILPS